MPRKRARSAIKLTTGGVRELGTIDGGFDGDSMTLRPGKRADIITIQYMRRRATSVCPDFRQLAQEGDVLVDAECDHERTILEQPEQCVIGPGETREQMHRLS
jgi:hypothetical protein